VSAPVVLISGSGRLAAAIERRLGQAGVRSERLPGSTPFHSISPAHLDSASVMVLAADDDAGNVDLALTVRRTRSDLPLVVRLFDQALVTYLRGTLDRVAILSMSAMAAPVFADAAIRAMSGRAGAPKVQARISRNLRLARAWLRPDRVLVGALLSFAVLVGLSSLFFSKALELPAIDALYFVWTTVMTVGYGDITLKDTSPPVKVAGMALMFAGAAFLAVLFALFTEWVITRRLNVLRGRVRVRGHGHVVVAGGGNVGLRVAALLREKAYRVVVIERDGDSRHAGALRAAGHHVIVADATSDGVFDLAALESASAVLALTNSDAINLHIALLVRANHPDIPVVMRVVSSELSAHVSERQDAIAISPLAVAVDEFVKATLTACGHPASTSTSTSAPAPNP